MASSVLFGPKSEGRLKTIDFSWPTLAVFAPLAKALFQCLFRAAKKDISSIWQCNDLVVFVAANFLSLVGWCLVNIDFCFCFTVEVDVSVWLMQGFFLFLITFYCWFSLLLLLCTFSFIFWGSYRFYHENCG